MVSQVPFCWVGCDFPNGLKFFLEQGRVHPDSSSNPQNSKMLEPHWTHRTMSGKEPNKMPSAGSFLFSDFTRSPRTGTERSKSHPGTRRGTGPTPLCRQSRSPHPALLTALAARAGSQHHASRVPPNGVCGPVRHHPPSPASSRMLTESAGSFSSRGQKCKPCLQG